MTGTQLRIWGDANSNNCSAAVVNGRANKNQTEAELFCLLLMSSLIQSKITVATEGRYRYKEQQSSNCALPKKAGLKLFGKPRFF